MKEIMRMKRNITALLVCVLTCIQWTAAQGISVDVPREVGQGEPFHIVFSITGRDVGAVRLPSLSGLDVFSQPSVSRSSSIQIINGRSSSSSSVSYTYTVAARQVGRITIGAASASVDGHTISSSPVSINVVKGNVHSQSPVASVSRNMDLQQTGTPVSAKDLYLTVTPSRTDVYEQEAVLLTYKLYARPNLGVSGIQLAHKPDFTGLVTQEIPTGSLQTRMENIGGSTYATAMVMQYVVFPQKSGDITIPAIDFICVVNRRKQYRDPLEAFFDDGGAVRENVSRSVQPLKLHVKPLPKPEPAKYSGGVGHFQVKGELITAAPASNDLATYRITISGSGNLTMITPPGVAFPKDFDVYDPKTTDGTQLTADGMTGKVVFDYTFVPRKTGKFVVPATSFVYFDTQAGRYVTLHTEALALDVKKGTRSDADVEREAALRQSDIRGLHGGTGKSTDATWWGSWSYVAAYILALLLAVVAFFFLAKRIDALADVAGRRNRKAGRVARRRLKRAAELLQQGNEAAFFDELSRSIYGYLADKYNVSVSELNKERIKEILSAAAVSESVIAQFGHILETCEYARFASAAAPSDSRRLFDSALAAIDAVEAKR